jgi:hypothetical protein
VRLFNSRVVRKRIMIGAMATSLIGVVGYFGFIAFILSGNPNERRRVGTATGLAENAMAPANFYPLVHPPPTPLATVEPRENLHLSP